MANSTLFGAAMRLPVFAGRKNADKLSSSLPSRLQFLS